jgi:Bacterial Ig-like domain (group 3)/FG-GAP-like repeat
MRRVRFVCLLQCLLATSLLAQIRPGPSTKRALPPELNVPGALPRMKPELRRAFSAAGNTSQASTASLLMKNAQYPTSGAAPSSVVVADVNGDGKPDEIVLDECTTGNNATCVGPGVVSVMLGNGDGTFQKAKTYGSGGYLAIQVVVADLNGDGKLDLAVLNTCLDSQCEGATDVGSISILLGNGDGTFQPAKTIPVGYYPSSMVAGNVDGDGKTDLIVSYFCDASAPDCAYGAVDVYLGKGDGTFKPPVDYSSGGYVTQEVILGDLNGDGKPDLIVANCGGANCFIGTVGVLINNGDGTFQPAHTYNSGGVLAIVAAVGDVNGDGNLDVVVDNDCLSPFPCSQPVVTVLLGNGDGTLAPAQAYNAGGYACFDSGYCPVSIALSDINRDGKLDVVAPFTILLGNGDGTFQAPISYSTDPCRRGEFAVADLNEDGKPDISIANYYASNGCSNIGLTVLLNISKVATITSLTSSLNPALVLQSVTYTAAVTSEYIGSTTGSVTFKSGTAVLGTVPLQNGLARITTAFNTSGSKFITAAYSGDTNNASSTSAALRQAVEKFKTSAVVTSSINPSLFPGPSPTFTAFITSISGPIPNGELVIFNDNAAPLTAARLSGGTASTTFFPPLGPGIHIITATYDGDASFAGSVSPPLKQIVNQK